MLGVCTKRLFPGVNTLKFLWCALVIGCSIVGRGGYRGGQQAEYSKAIGAIKTTAKRMQLAEEMF